MKQILFILTVLLFSCEKDIPEPTYCWKCNIKTTYKATGYTTIVKNDSITKCDFTEHEIKYYMSIKSEPVKLILDGMNKSITAESKYDCKKQ